jgi:hypothetical protein
VKTYIITLINGELEECRCDSIEFTPTHIVFESDNGKTLNYSILATKVLRVFEEGANE